MSPHRVCVCLGRQQPTSRHRQKSYLKMTSGATAAGCSAVRRWKERRREKQGWEQLTRSDTGKRGDLIAQLAKSTGRKRQERLVPSVWLGFSLPLMGPSVAFLFRPPPPTSFPHCCLSRLTTLEQNDHLSPPREHGSSW